MEKLLRILCFSLLLIGNIPLQGQTFYNFEGKEDLQGWSIDKGSLSISSEKRKLGTHSLHIQGRPGGLVTVEKPYGLQKASRSQKGGITAWIYNDKPVDATLVFRFTDDRGREICRQNFRLAFKGWRCFWSGFVEDMGSDGSLISNMCIELPAHVSLGNLYLDYLEFTPKVPWQKMSDAQYYVNRTDFSLIADVIGYRNTAPYVTQVKMAEEKDISIIKERLTSWYLGEGSDSHPWVELRKQGEKVYIHDGLEAGEKIHPAYDRWHAPIGEPLFPMVAPAYVGHEKLAKFRTINEKILLPLALDYRKNHHTESLRKALFIYDYFYDQGWADGSGMGSLCFERLRSSGYFHSFFLLKDELSPERLERELNALNWFTLFGGCYRKPSSAGEVADDLRVLALPKLIYALSLTDKKQQQLALTAFQNYMDNALAAAPGFFGTIKADFSGYHHRGPYTSAYYPQALYAGALIAYLLHGTPYALSNETLDNLKQALLTYRFFCANLDSPIGTAGRFPDGQQILETLLPAYAYVALSFPMPDEELVSAYKRIVENPINQGAIEQYLTNVNSNLTYTTSVGEAELMARLSVLPIEAEKAPTGSRFMPYSGLMVLKNKDFHFNLKGFSRYIWDFESSATENIKGRYLSYGSIEYFNLKDGNGSFAPRDSDFNWNHLPGTTTKVLPDSLLIDKGGASSGHRNFSDETFLAGVSGKGNCALFSFRMHDINYDTSLRANKSVFAFDDILLCMGSDIACRDTCYPVATTLFQVPISKRRNVYDIREERLLDDGTLLYAVCQGETRMKLNTTFSIAYIDHTATGSNQYLYYMLPRQNKQMAKVLLSDQSPIRIIEQDNSAHIVEYKDKGILYAALFDANKCYKNLPVKQINIPLAYLFEKEDDKYSTLTLCEPDMRRTSHAHMGELTEKDVIEEEKPFNTSLTLNGIYTVKCAQHPVIVDLDFLKNETTITLRTIRGENYRFQLQKQ